MLVLLGGELPDGDVSGFGPASGEGIRAFGGAVDDGGDGRFLVDAVHGFLECLVVAEISAPAD